MIEAEAVPTLTEELEVRCGSRLSEYSHSYTQNVRVSYTPQRSGPGRLRGDCHMVRVSSEGQMTGKSSLRMGCECSELEEEEKLGKGRQRLLGGEGALGVKALRWRPQAWAL